MVLAKANRNGRHWQLKSLRWTVEDAFQLPLDDRRHRPTWRDLGIAGL